MVIHTDFFQSLVNRNGKKLIVIVLMKKYSFIALTNDKIIPFVTLLECLKISIFPAFPLSLFG